MRRCASGAALLLALLGGGTISAQPAKPGAPPSAKAPAAAAAPTATAATTAGSAAPAVTGAPPASTAPTATGAPQGTATTPGQSAPAEDAGQLFQAAREAFKMESYERALALFQKSHALEATPGTLLNIALTEEKLGKTGAALRDFERVVGLFKADDDRMPIAKDGVQRVTVRAPRLKIDRAAGAPPTMAIRIDGEALAANAVGTEQVLDPGAHVVTTSVFGFEDRTYDVKLTEGQRLALAVETGKRTLVAAPVASAEKPAQAPDNAARLGGMVLGGVGIAGLGVGLVTGILAASKRGELNQADLCPGTGELCTRKGSEAVGATRTLADVSTGTLVFGAIAVAAGATLLFTLGDGKHLFVSASASPAGGGVAATGRF